MDLLAKGPYLNYFAVFFLDVKVNKREDVDIVKDVKSSLNLVSETDKPEIDPLQGELLDALNAQNARLHHTLDLERRNLVSAGLKPISLPSLVVCSSLKKARGCLKK